MAVGLWSRLTWPKYEPLVHIYVFLTLCVNESSLHTQHSEYRRETTSTEVGCIGGECGPWHLAVPTTPSGSGRTRGRKLDARVVNVCCGVGARRDCWFCPVISPRDISVLSGG